MDYALWTALAFISIACIILGGYAAYAVWLAFREELQKLTDSRQKEQK